MPSLTQDAEEIVLRLVEGIKPGGEAVGAGVDVGVGLAAGIVRGLMPGGGNGNVGWERVVVGLVEVVEGRDGKQRFGREGVDPVGDDE